MFGLPSAGPRALPRTRLSLVVLLAIVAATPAVHGLEADRRISQYERNLWTRSDGLPHSGVTALATTPEGYLWIGTQEGLSRFDGVRFLRYDRASVAAFEDHFITALAAMPDGTLWIGTRRGLLRFAEGGFERPAPFAGDYVRSLLVDRGGELWIGLYGEGLARWNGGRPVILGAKQGLQDGVVRALLEDRLGDLWVGTSRGVHRLSRAARDSPRPRLEAFTRADGLTSELIRALALDAAGTLWVGTEGGGLCRRRGDGSFEAVAGAAGLRTVGVLQPDATGTLWVGSHGQGLYRLHGQAAGESSAPSLEVDAWTAEQGLPHDVVWSLLEDREGSLWVGTRGGLVQLRDGNAISITPTQGLSFDDVRTVFQDSGGAVWIGGEGLDRWRNGELETTPLTPPAGGPALQGVRSLWQDGDGTLWIGLRQGLVGWDGRRWRRFDEGQGLGPGGVNALAEDAAGDLWVGTAGGLSRLRGNRLETWTREDGLPGDTVRALLAAPADEAGGGLWVGTEGGLARVRPGSDGGITLEAVPALAGEMVLALWRERRGVLWIGTSAHGLVRWQDGAVTRYRARDGLHRDLIFRILPDHRGGLWLSSNQGLSRVALADLEAFARGDLERLEVLRLDESDGMVSAEANGGTQPAGWRTRDGRLWFPTMAGVAVVDPARLERNRVLPRVVLEELWVEGERRALAEPVRLTPGERSLEIHYTAPTFVAPDRVRFRYRLHGFQETWVTAGNRRVAYFTNLPPGLHRFEVQVANSAGLWNPRPATLELYLEPFYWQRPVFWALLALLLVLAGVVAFRLRLRALEGQRRRLERLVEQRTAELAEANRTLERLARLDAVTGIPNHRELQSVLEREWRRAARSGEPLGLLMIDVDAFKAYNDALGHQQGDVCLRRVAETLQGVLQRSGDVVARYGGEEFVAVLPATPRGAARRLGEAVRQAVEAQGLEHPASPVAPVVTVSVGVAVTTPPREPQAEDRPDRLLTEADRALYAAKAAGRNRVEGAL